jgi:hypothetical protein
MNPSIHVDCRLITRLVTHGQGSPLSVRLLRDIEDFFMFHPKDEPDHTLLYWVFATKLDPGKLSTLLS